MASITKRGDRWRAEVRRKGFASQCKTFGTKAKAVEWARSLESAMDAGVTPTASVGSATIGDAIRAYRRLRGGARPIADTSNEHYQLKMLEARLGGVAIAACTPERLVEFATARRDEDGCGPYTINLDIGRLGTVLRYAASPLRMQIPDVVGDARPLLTHLRLIGGGERRERRPTADELTRILELFQTRHGPRYADAVRFAAVSAMRLGEICTLRASDIDPKTHIASILRKHPRKGKVLERVPLLGQAWTIVERQLPRDDGRVFGMHPITMSKYFTRACQDLSIPDLHFHDLRHEGTSALFEAGLSIEQVAMVTGHKTWNMLKRYTNLRPEDVKLPSRGTDPGTRPRRGSRRSVDPERGTS